MNIEPGKSYLIKGGNGYRTIESIVEDRVFWFNDSIFLRACSKGQFSKSCSKEISLEEIIEKFGAERSTRARCFG